MAKKRIYYTEFRRALETEAVKPVYLFTGVEAFLKEQGTQAILDKCLEPQERSMNLECLYAGTDVTGREVCERALTLPFFSGRRVLVVRQAERWRAGDVSAVADYARDPSASTVLIILSQDERIKLEGWKVLAEHSYHVECYPLFDNQVPGWIERRASEHGKRITREAIHLLIERVGQSLSDIDNEIGKLASYSGARSTITEDDIRASAGHLRQDRMHELNAALGRRDGAEAIRLLQHVLDEGLQPPQILGAIGWHMRSLLTARQRLDQGEDLERVLAGIRNPQARREMQSQLRSYHRDEFSGIFRDLLKLDEQVKTGKGHWELLLQAVILKICGARPEPLRARSA